MALSGVSKTYPPILGWRQLLTGAKLAAPRRPALEDVSFSVAEGELFGVLGPNGAGKSTLFKLLASLVSPDTGSLEVNGHDVRRDPAAVRQVLTPVMPDERSLFGRLSAMENLRLFGGLLGLSSDDALERARPLLERFALASLGDQACGTFSSGQKQRLLLARALLGRPRILLLDEPTRSLDPIAARDFRRLVREELCVRDRCTVLLATHSAEEAFDLCDRVAVLDRGRVIAEGRADHLRRSVDDATVRLTVRGPWEPVLAACLLRETPVAGATTADGWVRIEVMVAGGAREAAALLTSLVRGGVEVAALEPLAPDLATVLERLVAARGGRHHA